MPKSLACLFLELTNLKIISIIITADKCTVLATGHIFEIVSHRFEKKNYTKVKVLYNGSVIL